VKFFQLLVFLFATLAGYAQNGVQRVDTLLEAAKSAYPSDSALLLEQQALELSRAMGYTQGEARSLFYLGYFYQNTSEVVKASEYYLTGTQMNCPPDSTETKRWVLSAHINLSNILSDYELFNESVQILQEALNICADTRCQQFSIILYNLQQRYRQSGEFKKALDILNRMASLYDKESNEYFKALNGIGIVYNQKKQFKLAIIHYKKVLKEAKNSDNQKYLNLVLHNLADAYYHSGQLVSAKEILMQLIKENTGFSSETSYFTTYKDLITIHCQLEEYEEALRIWSKAKPTVKQTRVKRGDFYEVYKDVALAYEQTGRTDQAEQYRSLYRQELEKFQNTQSSLKQSHKTSKFLYTQARLKTTMQEFYADLDKERRQIQRQNMLVATTIGLSTLIIFMISYSFYQRRKKRKWISSLIDKLESP